MNPLVHYIRYGKSEKRIPRRDYLIRNFKNHIKEDATIIEESGLFDRGYYFNSYPDIALAGVDPLEHFCTHGWSEHRNPNAIFSTGYYLKKYPDVAKSGMNPFVHWLKWGRHEGRKIALTVVTPKPHVSQISTPAIIFVSHEASRTGAPAVLLSLMKWLRQNSDIQFSIICGIHGPLDKKFEAIAPTLYFEDHQGRDLREALRLFCGNNVQYVYCNTIVSAVYANHLQYLNAQFIAHVHELEGLFRVFEQQFLQLSKYCRKYIAVSDAVKSCIDQRIPQNTAEIQVLSPFIDAYDLSQKPTTKLRKSGQIIVFGCGGIEVRKGFDLFCGVGRKILDAGRHDIKLYWIGSDIGTDLDPLTEIARLDVGKIVEWLGPKDYPRGYFEDGDIFILTSREDPYPLVCLEAAERGLPVICFDERGGGMWRFVDDDAGIVVPHMDIDAMAKAVIELADDDVRRKALGATAKRKSLSRHGVESVAPLIADLFKDAQSSSAATELEAFFEQIDRSEIVSFDIFDTLVTRKVSDPNVVFDLIEFQHTQSEPAPLSLFHERMDAAGAELGSHAGRIDDVTIDKIYERMPVFKDAKVEKDAEVNICIRHPIGYQLFQYALERGKRVYIASDMYLDMVTVERILRNCGYDGWDRLFLSSDLGMKKDTGRLYGKLLTEAGLHAVSADQILHIGDNWASDVLKARTFGIRALWFSPIYEEKSAIIGLPAHERHGLSQAARIWEAVCTQAYRLWIKSHPDLAQNVFIRLGFQLTGPFAAMLAMHVRKIAETRGVKRIYFLARDGRIVKDAFDVIYRHEIDEEKFETRYIHLSRATVIPATLQNPLSSNDLYFLMEGLHLRQKKIRYFLEKANLDLDDPDVLALVANSGMALDDIPSWEERAQISKLLLSLSQNIYDANSQTRSALKQYLFQSGFFDQEITLIVDVGWLLNIQSRLVQFVSQNQLSTKVVGCYVGSRDRINKRIDHECLLFEKGEPARYSHLIDQHTTLFELLFSAPEPSARRLIEDDGIQIDLKPVNTASSEFIIASNLSCICLCFERLYARNDFA
jgi:predicted HAD superfamily hydrolase/glycosyltransferase involved in cell wall biosynthesis